MSTRKKQPTGHTAGPYEVRPNLWSTGFHVYQAQGHRHLADVMEKRAGITKAEASANAYLFAAAPDLLAACKAALVWFDCEQDTTAAELCRAAIAKAESPA